MNFGEWCYWNHVDPIDLQKILNVSERKLRKLKKGEYTGDVLPLLKIVVITQGKVKIEDLIHPDLLHELATLSSLIKKSLIS